jgi:hypothetical protein
MYNVLSEARFVVEEDHALEYSLDSMLHANEDSLSLKEFADICNLEIDQTLSNFQVSIKRVK